MKKNMKYVFVAAIAMMAGINVFNAQKTEGLSDVSLANVEALAQYEGGDDMLCSAYQDYAYASKAVGQFQEFFHCMDGKDQVITYDVTDCMASGKGTLWGASGVSYKKIKQIEYI